MRTSTSDKKKLVDQTLTDIYYTNRHTCGEGIKPSNYY